MKMLADRVLIDLGPLEQKNGSIIVPDSIRKHKSWGKVVSVGPEVKDLKKGTQILYRMDGSAQINGGSVQVVKTNSMPHPMVIMDEPLVQAKFKKRMNTAVVDFSKVEPLGSNIILDLEIPEQEHKGLWVPEFKFGSKALIGKVVAMGPNAMDMFANKEEFGVGDTILMSRRVSGGMLPYQDSPRFFRTLSISVMCVMREGGWFPVRDYVMMRAVWPDLEIMDPEEVSKVFNKGDRGTRYKKKGDSLVIIPNLPSPRMGVIMSAGGGLDPFSKNEEISANMHSQIKVGKRVLIPLLLSPDGKIVIGDAIMGKEEHDMVVIINTRHILGVLPKGEHPDSLLKPNMELSDMQVKSLVFG